MKSLIAFCVLIAVTHAEIASSNKHHTEHEKSVEKAKQSLQERLSLLESQSGYNRNQATYGNAYGASGSEKYVAGCSSCTGGSENRVSYNSRQSSSSQRLSSRSGHGISGSDYEGVGIVGHSADDNDDVQSIVAPTYSNIGSSRYSSSANAYEADEMQQRVVPGDLSAVSSSAYRSRMSELDDDELQRTVGGSGYVGSGHGSTSRIYSQTRDSSASETSRTGSVAVPVYVSGVQRASSSQSQSESEHQESRRPVPTGQYVSISARPGTSTVLAVPVRVIHTQGVPDYQVRTSEHSSGSESSSSRVQNPTSTTYRVTYSPSRNYVTSDKIASTSESESTRTVGSVQQPEKFTNYNTFNTPDSASQTRFRADESDVNSEQVRVAPVTITGPTYGGSSRYHSTGSSGSQHGYTQSRVVPVFPVNAIESSSSSRTAEEKEQRRYTASNPTYISASRINADQEESRNQQSSVGGSTTYYVPSSSHTRYQTQQQSGSGSQTQYQQRQGYGGGSFTPYGSSRSQTSGSQSSDRLSTRYGSGVLNTHTDDLQTYMSESERLARLQQQQIAGSSSGISLSNLDANRRTLNTASNLDSAAANFVRSSNLANRNSEFDTTAVDGAGAGTGGYNRVRSWNKQSKWSSGSEYGPDGKPKSFSHLSTAEAEKYNINGAETGYKAATTTLENDGKVSTYSIHTP